MKNLQDKNRIGNIPTLDDICGVNIFKQITQPTFNEPRLKINNSVYKITLPKKVQKNKY